MRHPEHKSSSEGSAGSRKTDYRVRSLETPTKMPGTAKIIFEAHGTTVDNEAHRSSGWFDVALSDLGRQQSRKLGERYRGQHFDAVFCSDLRRSIDSARLAFNENVVSIKIDQRLRECDYGSMTRLPSEQVDKEKVSRILVPFPEGESYQQTTERIGNFLKGLKRNYDSKTVMIIGHRATQYGLEFWINHKKLEEIIPAAWKWQPGWIYTL